MLDKTMETRMENNSRKRTMRIMRTSSAQAETHETRIMRFSSFCVVLLSCCLSSVDAQQPDAVDCTSFGGDVAYYKESCLNATHYIVQTGSCINGASVNYATDIGPCTDEGNLQHYCHECSSSDESSGDNSRLMCSSHSQAYLACPWALESSLDTITAPSSCPSNSAGDSSATTSGCSSHSYYYYASQSCTANNGIQNQGLVQLRHKVRPCAEDFGSSLPYCASCADGFQLCASEARTAIACGSHGVAAHATFHFVQDALTGGTRSHESSSNSEGSSTSPQQQQQQHDTPNGPSLGYVKQGVLSLPVDVECSTFEGDLQFYREDCYNETHYVITTGQCRDGILQNATSEASACSMAGAALQYCHTCSAAGESTSSTTHRLVCAESSDVNQVCQNVVQEPEPLCSGTSSAMATNSLGLPSALQRQATTTGCASATDYYYDYELCNAENLPNQPALIGRQTSPCASSSGSSGSGDLQYCSTCQDGWQLCASTTTACGSHGTVPLLPQSTVPSDPAPPPTDSSSAPQIGYDEEGNPELLLPVTMDCSSFNGGEAVSWYKEDCYNATHYRVSSGICLNGQVDVPNSSVIVTACATTLPLDDIETMAAYCHTCRDGQLICSETEQVNRVCGRATALDASTQSPQPQCGALEYRSASKTGCLSASSDGDDDNDNDMYYSQMDCVNGQYRPNMDTQSCDDLYGPTMSQCVQCADGHQLCTNDLQACDGATHGGAVDLEDGDSNSIPPINTIGDSPGEENNDASQVMYLPVDVDCSTFKGNVGFYREDCFNTTHYVITQGNCIDGQLLDAVTAVSPCTTANDAGGENDNPLAYCHKCDYKLVCSAMPNPQLVCARAMTTPDPFCVESLDRVASYTGCTAPTSTSTMEEDVSGSFYYNIETCQAGELLVEPSVQDCSDIYANGMDICLACVDGMQLCASQVDGCGSHGGVTPGTDDAPPDVPPELVIEDQDTGGDGGTDPAMTLEVDLDCSTFEGDTAWYREDCYNATHYYISSGSCIGGQLINATSVVQSCHSIHDTLQYCHGCYNKLTCSQEPILDRACASAFPDPPVCRSSSDDIPRNILDTAQPPAMDSWSTLTGCVSETSFYYNAQECDQGTFYDEPWQGPCLEAFPGTNLGLCLTCADGMQLCASAPNACGSHGDLGDSDNADGSDGSQGESIPVTGIDCTTFGGDVQFYKESCYNATHMVETTGFCSKGILHDAKSQVTPCRVGTGSLESASYCYECPASIDDGRNKLVCSESPAADQVCPGALSDPPVCTDGNDRSATATGCSSNEAFFYNYETCENGELTTVPDTNNCNELFPGHGQCLTCQDGFQLCAASSEGCGAHGDVASNHGQDGNVVLTPPIDCSQVTSDLNFYTEKCLNATHMITWSGQCIGGLFVKSQPEILPCSNSGTTESYCHECPGSHLVCSASSERDTACALHSTLEASSCANNPDATGSFGGCLDSQKYFYTTEQCVEGNYANQQSSFSCVEDYPDLPYCESCGSFTICAKEQKTCVGLGLHALESGPGTPEDHGITPALSDTVECSSAKSNFSYYTESCFNTTHVQIMQGECIDGAKVHDQAVLRSCQVYGEDEKRSYCHQCGASVTCSSQRESHLECLQSQSSPAMLGTCPNPDSTLSLTSASTSDLSASFGCLDDTTFYTTFATCQNGQIASEKNGFVCGTSFPGYSYCNTCGGINICSAEQATCAELGFPTSPSNDMNLATSASQSESVSWRRARPTWATMTAALLAGVAGLLLLLL